MGFQYKPTTPRTILLLRRMADGIRPPSDEQPERQGNGGYLDLNFCLLKCTDLS
jgi:hypothetical protein